MPKLWHDRFANLRVLGWVFLGGIPLLLMAALTANALRTFFLVGGVLAILPACIYFYVLTIWHWKARYKGSHSDLWGFLLLVETSGWSKIIYFFRHILPDLNQSGRYRLADHGVADPGSTSSAG